MGVETVSLIIAAFVNGSLGIAALMRNFRSRLCISFAVLAGILFAHDSLAVLESFAAGGSWASPRWHSLLMLIAGPAALWLLRRIVPLYQRQLKPIVWGYLGLVAMCTPIFFLKVYSQIYLLLGIFSHALFLVPAAIWVFTLAGVRDTQLTRERLRIRYAFWGGVFTIAFFVTDAFRFIGFHVPPLGTLARTLYLIFLFQTFIQKELMTSEEVVGKISLFSGIALMLSSIYALLVSWVGDQPDLFFFNTLIASFVIMFLFDPIRNLSARLTRKLFLRRNAMLEDALHRLSEELMGAVEPVELSRRLGMALKKAFSVERWALYLAERDGLSYVQVDGAQGQFSELSSSNPLIEYMTLRGGRSFVLESIENDRDSFYSFQPRKFCQACLDAMRNVGADCVIVFMHENRLVGFFALKLGERVVLSNEQLRLFNPLARQIAFLLRNAQTFSYLRDRDKLVAVGEMAAGLAHEIKNPLGAIKGAAELLSEEGRDSEFLKIIVDETNRLSGVLSDFLDYAKPRRVDLQQTCDVGRVLDHTAAMILRDRRVSVEIVTEEKNITLEADPEILKQVFLNLFLNAVQAMEGFTDKPKLKVTVREIRPRRLFPFSDSLPKYKVWEGWKPRGIGSARPYIDVEIEDNGVGITTEDIPRIFVPFFTTKPKGTGLGLAICQRLVEGMGGTIHVRPNHPTGSVFVIHLPIKRDELREEKRLYETTENFSRR